MIEFTSDPVNDPCVSRYALCLPDGPPPIPQALHHLRYGFFPVHIIVKELLIDEYDGKVDWAYEE